jgi:hypothetical protein
VSTPSSIARYTVVQPIAAGGMGEVFLARDEKLDRLVAIKLLRDGFDSDELLGRFEEEARNVAKLTHPNIVTIYEYGTHDQKPYIAMEYVAGHSLAELIRRKVPLSLARRIRLIEEVCAGLGHAHKAHLVHRDVKPANLMVTTSGMVKVLDFGIAKLRGTDRTQKGMIVGTVNYMSPEQITGQPVDHRSDVFAVGAVLHEVLTYDQAFKGDLTTAMFAIVHGQPEPLAARCPGLDPAVQAVVDRCLAKDPGARYQDLAQLKRDLAKLRRPLEDDDEAEAGVPLDLDKTIIGRAAGGAGTDSKAVGADTRRALGAALAAGEAAMATGQFESAVRHAEQALALEGANISALDLLQRATAARDKARVASRVGQAQEALRADRLDDARAALDAAAALAPESPTVHDIAARVDARAADLERFDQTIVLAREHFDAHDLKKARDLAETAVIIRPADTELHALRKALDEAEASEQAWVHDELTSCDAQLAAGDLDGAAATLDGVRARVPDASGLAARLAALEAARAEERRAADALAREEAERARQEEARQREEAARQREAEAREREAAARQRAAEERARRIETLVAAAGSTDTPLAARREALTELLRLDPGNADAAALKPSIDAALAEAARQKALDDALTAGAQLLSERKFDAAAAKVADVATARPGDARAAALTVAIAEGRKRDAALREALRRAEAAAAAGRFDEALTVLGALDAGDADVTALLGTVQREQREALRRERVAALTARVKALASSRATLGGLAAAATLMLAIWLWPAGSPPPTTPAPDAAQNAGPFPPATAGDVTGSPGETRGGATAKPAGGALAAETTSGSVAPSGGTTAAPTLPSSDGVKPGPRPEVTKSPGREALPERSRRGSGTPTRPASGGTAAPEDPATTPAEAEDSVPSPPVEPTTPAPVPLVVAPYSRPLPGASPPDAPAIQRQLDESRLRSLIGLFGAAYQGRDVNAMKAAWPAMSRSIESSYRSVFQSYSQLGWLLQGTDLSISGDTAEATAQVLVSLRELRANAATTERRSYRFTFARRATGWAIANVENLR